MLSPGPGTPCQNDRAVVLLYVLDQDSTLDQTTPALQEVRRVWLGYMSQCDASLGQRIAAKVQAAGSM